MTNRVPKVAWIWTINPGVTWYRMFKFVDWLSNVGLVNSFFFPDWEPRMLMSPNWEGELQKYLPTFEGLVENCDMLIMQYVSTAHGVALVQGLRDYKPTFMEVDDYFSAVPAYSCAYESNKPGDRQDCWATRQMHESSGLVCSTQFLADHGKQFNPNVHVIPNCIDFSLWDRETRPENERVRIGWVGGATHEGDLKLVKDVIYEVLDAHPNCEVMICTSPPPSWPKHERLLMVDRWVTIDHYADMVKSMNFDIGIAPLRDNYFNRGKSNLRFLEMSAMKIPTVASPVEPFKHDFTGYLCATDQEWFDTLSMLIKDPALRLQDGLKAYDQVTTKFSLERIALKYYGLIMETIGWESHSLPVSQESSVLSPAQP